MYKISFEETFDIDLTDSINYEIIQNLKYIIKQDIGFYFMYHGLISFINDKYVIYVVKHSSLFHSLDSNKLNNNSLNIYKYNELPILHKNYIVGIYN